MSIGDTGASSDTTTLDLGFQNKEPANAADHIVDASGNDLIGKTAGDVSGVFCDKYGTERNKVIIEEMVYSPDSEFNVFSLTIRLDAGYELGDDKNAIWISKGDQKIGFDIKIKTLNEAIFVAYFKLGWQRSESSTFEQEQEDQCKHSPRIG